MDFSLNGLMMNIVENGVATAGVEMLKLQDVMIQGNSPMMYYGRMGLVWTLADEVVLFLKTGTSHLLAGNYYYVVDQLFLNSWLCAVIEMSGIGERVLDATDVLPFGATINGAVATGAIKVSAKVLTDILEPRVRGTPLQYINSITSLIRG